LTSGWDALFTRLVVVENKKDAKALIASVLGGEKPPEEPTETSAEPVTETMATPEEPTETMAAEVPPREVTETMAGAKTKHAAADLVDQALEGAAPSPEEPAAPAADDSNAEAEAEAEAEASELIEVYFELEEPTERDALFDQLIAIEAPVVTEFLRVMMLEDEDEYVRAAAAAELARRGVAEAIEILTGDLEDPEEPFFFEQAVQVLAEVLGTEFYGTLVTLWQDPNRDADQRREAMLGLETIDAERALTDFISFIETIENIDTMADDQVEVAMMAFARHEHAAAKPALEKLRERVLAATIDADERTELAGFLAEGLSLL